MRHHQHQKWPRLEEADHLTACHFCDTLYHIELIEEGESATCQTCGQNLYSNRPVSLERAVSFSITGLFLMVLMELFPFMSLDVQGNGTVMSINQAVVGLWNTGGRMIALFLAGFALILN
jgi:paraquat-inducible protein A